MSGDRVVVPPGCAPLPGAFNVTVRVRSEHTGGVLSVIEETLPPKSFIVPHVHRNDVWVYVLSGEVGVLVGEVIATAASGEWALKPRDVEHAMWNASPDPARIVEVLTPGGGERWFEEIAVLADDDRQAFDDACRRHGIVFFPHSPWATTICTRFGLREG